MDELFGTANFGEIEDVGVAAQTGKLKVEGGSHIEDA